MTVVALSLRAACCAAVLLAAPAARAQEGLERAFPADALLFVTVDDREAFSAACAETAWGRFFGDPALQPMWDAFRRARSEMSEEALADVGVDPWELFDMARGAMAFGVLAMDKDAIVASMESSSGWTPDEEASSSPFPLALGLLLELGDDRDEFADGVDTLVDQMVERQEGLVLKTETLGDVDVTLVTGRGPELRYGFVGDHFVATLCGETLTDRDHFGALVEGLRGESEEDLAEDGRFSGSVAARTTGGVRGFVDYGVVAMLGAEITAMVAPTGAATPEEVEAWMAFSIDASAAGFDIRVDSFQEMTTEQLAMVTAMYATQDPVALSWMPPTAWLATAVQIDAAAWADFILESLTKSDPEMARSIVTGMSDIEADYGFHPRDDFIDNLDGQFGYHFGAVDPSEALPLPIPDLPPFGMAFTFGLQDGEALRTVIDSVVRKAGVHAARRREDFDGYTVEIVPISFMNVAFAVTDDLFVLSMAPSMVRDVLRRRANPELESVATSKGYLAARSRVPDERGVEFHITAADFANFVLFVMAQAQAEDGDVLPGVTLPGRDVVARHLQGSILGSALVEEGGVSRWFIVTP